MMMLYSRRTDYVPFNSVTLTAVELHSEQPVMENAFGVHGEVKSAIGIYLISFL